MSPDILRCEFCSDTKSLCKIDKSRHHLLIVLWLLSPEAQISFGLAIWTVSCASGMCLKTKLCSQNLIQRQIKSSWVFGLCPLDWAKESTNNVALSFWVFFYSSPLEKCWNQQDLWQKFYLEKNVLEGNRKYLKKWIHKPVNMQIHLRNSSETMQTIHLT